MISVSDLSFSYVIVQSLKVLVKQSFFSILKTVQINKSIITEYRKYIQFQLFILNVNCFQQKNISIKVAVAYKGYYFQLSARIWPQ